MKYTLEAIILLIALCAVACFHKVTTSTVLVVKTYVQSESGGTNNPAVDIKAFAFYLDESDYDLWKVESYDDALSGTITNSVTGERITAPDVTGYPFTVTESANTYIAMDIEDSPIFLVVVNVTDRMYAYAPKKMEAENLPETYLTLIFHTWKGTEYTQGNSSFTWTIVPNISQP